MAWTFPYDSPNAINAILEDSGCALSKRFGQNFLLSSSVRQRIADSLDLQSGMQVWEVGPGIGSLTSLLLQRQACVTAFEIDHGFCRILQEQAFGDEPCFRLVEGDVLKTWEREMLSHGIPDRLCGNLPYNVGSLCIARFLENRCTVPLMVYMVQKEVAQRLSAGPGSKSWSSLGLLAQLDYDVKTVLTVRPGSFHPAPQVDSAVVRMTKRPVPLVEEKLRGVFLLLAQDMFKQRRKMVSNNLLSGSAGDRWGRQEILEGLSISRIDPKERCETIGIDRLSELAAFLCTIQVPSQ